jgi:hypothetical protein
VPKPERERLVEQRKELGERDAERAGDPIQEVVRRASASLG